MTTTSDSQNPHPDTPYLVVDSTLLDANLSAMSARADHLGLDLRPHAKTHKSIDIARRQVAAGAVGLTVATIGEAEVFAAAGFDDLFIAYPLWLSPNKVRRLHALASATRLRVGADSIPGVEQLAQALTGTGAEVLVEVDSGQHRTGTSPEEVVAVARSAIAMGLDVAGVFTFPGHGYGPGLRAQAADDEGAALADATRRLTEHGMAPRVISGGSTPTVAAADAGVLTEIRPGVYPFNDAQQVELGTCDLADVALVAVGTVVHRTEHTAVLDTGSKILGADRPSWATGHGRLPDHPAARIVALSEHHATVDFSTERAPDLGARVRVAPNHVCTAVNLVDDLVVVRDGSAVARWPVSARGRN
ncbi:alanine racemase [Williamsia sterculiae]|uniref:D-serine deaminase, pyridoxal phosphate-dependent n=1 Tax=Williamsia sterculiae TaxID=1344003 RepID=A0A1N7DVI4_9NOCA|nr:alanine racemase [Williamsia sterculiae]SIR79862.1 D-serine deaminase, pyridoxal phosphate-dependent [Williamsia sterculiae]